MRKFLNYIHPENPTEVVWGEHPVNEDFIGYNTWLSSMIEAIPGIIFFYTTDSTDVFFEEEVRVRQGFYNFEGLTVLEVYNDYTITTRNIEGSNGCRVYLPYGQGILNFTSNIEAARDLIDRHALRGDTL